MYPLALTSTASRVRGTVLADEEDLEDAPLIVRVSERPPSRLAAYKKEDTEITQLVSDIRHRIKPGRGTGIRNFYTRQNELIDDLIESEQLHSGDYSPDEETPQEVAQARRAVNLSFAGNIALLFIRVGIAVLSSSLSIIVTTLDAALDVISGFIIWFTSWSATKQNKYKYPIGKARMEPLGIIVFSCIMGTAGFSIVGEGARQLVEGTRSDLPNVWLVIAGALLVIVMKGALYLYCRNSKSSSVQAFALDHINDVIVNSFGLAGALLGKFVAWWCDPSLAILMAFILIWIWGRQAHEHVVNLVGVGASPELLQKLTYIALHHPGVLQIDTVRAFSFGDSWMVEVDVVLPRDMQLHLAHDIGEGLQIKLERLPEVARAYVHLDYETTHAPEHKTI